VLKFVEITAIRLTANRVFVVSDAMREHLQTAWGVKNSTVLYDMPNNRTFKPLNLKEKHAFLLRFAELSESKEESVVARQDSKAGLVEREGRPLLFVVSSSWSHDDDFDTLIAAVKTYEANTRISRQLIFVLTGSGPVKGHYSSVFRALKLSKVRFVILWFEAGDYPTMVGCCDYGISLHNSTSGFDLPIKALDYMACGVPCIAYEYTKTIKELVVSQKNGLLFRTADDLAGILVQVASKESKFAWDFPKGNWTTEWREKVAKN
jgi:beta-1,4-mannosyltransferase